MFQIIFVIIIDFKYEINMTDAVTASDILRLKNAAERKLYETKKSR